MPGPVGVCLLYMGGPENLQEVGPFLRSLFADRELIRLPGGPFLQGPLARLVAWLRTPVVQARYRLIGGGSPQKSITLRQASLLAEALRPCGEFAVEVAQRYTAPRAAEAVARLRERGVRRLVALPLYPQFSAATTGSSFRDLDRALAEAGAGVCLEVVQVRDFHAHPRYLEALAGCVRRGLDLLGVPASEACVVFSAHSLPLRLVKQGDPYAEQVRATAAGVARRLGLVPGGWHLGFQSRSGPVRWLGPEVARLLDRLVKSGERHLLLVAVSFVSDHIETLYEIDVELRERCLARGAKSVVRAPSLNLDPTFIDALKEIVLSTCQSQDPEHLAS